ncbi:MAG TPA: serine protease [Steroidobacteraceae bacterium]|jgi:hypothetical protein
MTVDQLDIQQVARAEMTRPKNAEPVNARFETVRPRFEGAPRSAELMNWQTLEGLALALVFTDGAHHYVLGSAVLVAPCTALCATHTLTDHARRVEAGELSLAAMGITSHGLQVWHVTAMIVSHNLDVSILLLSLESDLPAGETATFYQAMITTRAPRVGEQVVFAGFRADQYEFQPSGVPRTMELSGNMRIGSGRVTQVFPEGRDRVLVPWPAFEVDAPLFGGMSGGPVFDERGGLIGLGSRSLDMGPADEPAPMIVALLWPVLAQEFPIEAPHCMTTLLDLHNVLTVIERPEAVARTGQGSQIQYTAWS